MTTPVPGDGLQPLGNVAGRYRSGNSRSPKAPFPANLAMAAALGQVSEPATTWQIFRKMEYAAGKPQNIVVRSQRVSRAIGPAGAAMGSSSPCPSPRNLPSVARVEAGTLSHERIGRTRVYVITKWRQSEIQQVKKTKVPPPRTHGKVGDPVGGQCGAVR